MKAASWHVVSGYDSIGAPPTADPEQTCRHMATGHDRPDSQMHDTRACVHREAR